MPEQIETPEKEREAQVRVLKMLREDVKELGWEELAEDGHTILVAKADVLELIQDWIEHSLNPEMDEATP